MLSTGCVRWRRREVYVKVKVTCSGLDCSNADSQSSALAGTAPRFGDTFALKTIDQTLTLTTPYRP